MPPGTVEDSRAAGRVATWPKGGLDSRKPSSNIAAFKKELAFTYSSVSLLAYTHFAAAPGSWSL
jgi:hypothetical protein